MRSNEEIISLMETLRLEKNISISELSRRVNMAKSGVSRYFNRTRQFPLDRADAFAKALGVSSEFLLGVSYTEKTRVDLSNLKSQTIIFDGKELSESEVERVQNIVNNLSLGVTDGENE
ncbi:TPA: helix-turn-helix domain-containing protein [Streptococcus suis]